MAAGSTHAPRPITQHAGDPAMPPFVSVQLTPAFVPDTAAKQVAWTNGDLSGLARRVAAPGLRRVLDALGRPPARPVLEVNPARLLEQEASRRGAPFAPRVSLTQFWKIDLRSQPDRVPEALAMLRELPAVELAWQIPHLSNPTSVTSNPELTRQTYTRAGPRGIGAKAAWDRGIFGGGVGFVDLERAWHPRGHADLPAGLLSPPVAGLGEIVPLVGRNAADEMVFECGDIAGSSIETGGHGIHTLGVVLARNNTLGIMGLAPDAEIVGVASYVASSGEAFDITTEYTNLPNAIYQAGMALRPGDVLLLEVQAVQKSSLCIPLPVEDLPDVRAAIALAASMGRIVVEPAGNGGISLDALASFDPSDTAHYSDSGAILVAASLWDGNTHKQQRLGDSNYGQRVDCFAPGDDVHTCTGDVSTASPWTSYGAFTGTSAASAVIAGAALLTQSYARTISGTTLGPGLMRTLLGSVYTGTKAWRPGGGSLDLTIGVMPDLTKVLHYL